MHFAMQIRKDFFKMKRRSETMRRKKWTKRENQTLGMRTRNQMLFGYLSASIFQDALTSALCECVYFLFVCLFVRVLFSGDLCAWKMIEGGRLHATIKSLSHHRLCDVDSCDCFN